MHRSKVGRVDIGRNTRYMYMRYTYIDYEYHSKLLTTFNPTVNKPTLLTHVRRKD